MASRGDRGGRVPVPGPGKRSDTVIAAMQTGNPVARIELLDDVQMDASIRYSKLEGLAVKPTLFFNFTVPRPGSANRARQWSRSATNAEAARLSGRHRWRIVRSLWKARHAAYYAAMAYRPGMTHSPPIPAYHFKAGRLRPGDEGRRRKKRPAVVDLGHVGDGNFHLVVLFIAKARNRETARKRWRRVSMRAIAMGGTCTGEHGIGYRTTRASASGPR